SREISGRMETMRIMMMWRRFGLALMGLLGMVLPAQAESLVVGTIKSAGAGPLLVAQERGYFKAEGLEVDFRFFDASQPIAVANVSGDVDIGATPPTAAFYALASQGVLRIISGYVMDAPTFQA